MKIADFPNMENTPTNLAQEIVTKCLRVAISKSLHLQYNSDSMSWHVANHCGFEEVRDDVRTLLRFFRNKGAIKLVNTVVRKPNQKVLIEVAIIGGSCAPEGQLFTTTFRIRLLSLIWVVTVE